MVNHSASNDCCVPAEGEDFYTKYNLAYPLWTEAEVWGIAKVIVVFNTLSVVSLLAWDLDSAFTNSNYRSQPNISVTTTSQVLGQWFPTFGSTILQLGRMCTNVLEVYCVFETEKSLNRQF